MFKIKSIHKPIILLLILLIVTSCTKKYDIQREELLGEWRTTDMFVNGDDSEIPFNTNGLVIMGLLKEYYFYNFSSGDWEVEKDKISLTRGEELFREYTVNYFDGDSLVVESEIIESQLFFNIESIEENETFILTEHLKKQ